MIEELSFEAATDIVDALRDGTVPGTGLEHIAVGMDAPINAIKKELEQVATKRGGFKAIRGEYGSGKTFLSRLVLAEAERLDFATAHVTLSAQETRLYKPEELYRAIARELALPGVRRAALGQLVERWIARHARAVRETDGIADDDPRHEQAVERRIQRALEPIGSEAASFAMALGAYYSKKRAEDFAGARGLLGFLAGDPNVGHAAKSAAGVTGKLEKHQGYAYLRALLEVVTGAGLAGLAVVLDEGDRLTELRGPERKESWEVLRYLIDKLRDNTFSGLYIVLTGTRNLFEGKKGIREYGALEERLSADFSDEEHPDWMQRQIRLRGMDRERLLAVARRVREIFPTEHAARIAAKANDNVLDHVVASVTKAFGGKVTVAPRRFLREWVGVLSRVHQYEDYDPATKYGFDLAKQTDLTPEEKVAAGLAAAVADDPPPEVF